MTESNHDDGVPVVPRVLPSRSGPVRVEVISIGRDLLSGRTADRNGRFLAILSAIGNAQIDDVFHLWTAEDTGLEVFLTMDLKFLNVMRQQGQRVQSPVSVWSPRDLCASLGERSTDIDVLAVRHHPFR